MIDIREILVRIFSAIFLSMCTGSCMFVFWMALRKFFADKIRPKVYDLILKIILIAYYVPAGYLLVNIFFDNGHREAEDQIQHVQQQRIDNGFGEITVLKNFLEDL